MFESLTPTHSDTLTLLPQCDSLAKKLFPCWLHCLSNELKDWNELISLILKWFEFECCYCAKCVLSHWWSSYLLQTTGWPNMSNISRSVVVTGSFIQVSFYSLHFTPRRYLYNDSLFKWWIHFARNVRKNSHNSASWNVTGHSRHRCRDMAHSLVSQRTCLAFILWSYVWRFCMFSEETWCSCVWNTTTIISQ